MPATVEAKVDTVSGAISALQPEWTMLEALMGGTSAMRAVGTALLPQWPGEADDSYKTRKDTATLFPAFRRTVSVMAGKPFSKQAVLDDGTPAQIKAWAEDIDREGVSLHVFAAEMLTESIAFGLCGILVEAPKPTLSAGKVATKAEQDAAGIRPYFVRVKHNQIRGYRVEVINGARKLTQLRIAECVTVADGQFGEAQIEQIRVLEPGSWQVWRKEKDTWTVWEEGASGLEYIPFVPCYGTRLAFMMGISPLRDLAYLNVKHWQSQSDQDTILHVARVPILAISGGDDDTSITVGAASAVKLPMGAELKFVEHTGAAIEAGAKSLSDLEDQMIQSGAELLVKQPGQRTATESSNDAEANKSELQRIVEDFEDSLDQALQMMADYAKLGKGGNVTLFKDFGAATLSDASAQLIVTLEQGGVISTATAIAELQRRGTLSPDIEAEAEAEAVASQGPALGAMTSGEGDGAPPPEGAQAQAA
jgi:hypothetical protein